MLELVELARAYAQAKTPQQALKWNCWYYRRSEVEALRDMVSKSWGNE